MTIQPLLLAVDDEPGILRLLKLELGAQGFKVLTASNGDEAIRVIEERRPDCVLLDVMMPGESGLEVMKKIRERGRTPVLLLTAKDKETDKVRGLELGADSLDAVSPRRSSGQPGSDSGPGALLPYLALLPVGFTRPPCCQDAGALLPHHFTLTRADAGGMFLLHWPSAFAAQVLPGTVPGGVRTFLCETAAAAWPAGRLHTTPSFVPPFAQTSLRDMYAV